MSETETPVVETPAAVETPAEEIVLSLEAQNIQTILKSVEENPEMLGNPEIAALVKSATELKAKNGKETPAKAKETPKKETPAAATPAATTETVEEVVEDVAEETEEVEEAEETKSETDKKDKASVFFKKAAKAPTKVEVKDLNEVVALFKSRFGIEAKDTNEAFTKFFDSADSWRKMSTKTAELENYKTQLEEAFKEMPEPLFNVFTKWANAQEWETEFKHIAANKLDFSKKAEEQDVAVLVNHYFPNEFEAKDLTDNKEEANVKKAISLALRQYDIDKKSVESQRTALLTKANAQKTAFKASAQSSVAQLKESFPGLEDAALKRVALVMTSSDFDPIFFEKDGTYKKDAAVRLAMALYGEQEIMKAHGHADEQAKVLKSVVDKGTETPAVNKNSQQPAGKEIPANIAKLFDGLVEKHHY